MSPNLLKVILRGTIFGFSAVAILALLPLIVREVLSGSALTYGILLGCFGMGAVVGAFLNARLRARFHNEALTRAAFVVFGLACVVLAISRSDVISGLALLCAGGAWVIALSLFNVTVQLSTPRWVVGRALALYQTGVFGGMAAGSWIWGVVAESHGAGEAMLGAAGVLAFGALVGLRAPLPDLAAANLDPLNRFEEPPLRLDIRQRSGPIMIMVDYQIAQGDIPEFLAAMAERRRIRIRNGAQQWALLRDLEKPEVWTETYHVPTWVEYVRHHERHTHADAVVSDRLRSLHRGETGPLVHRMIERQTISVFDDMPLMASEAS